jgi:hypothetical protein
MMKMQEAGMMERWKDEWWSTIDSCSASTRSSGAQSLGMDSLAGLFYAQRVLLNDMLSDKISNMI